MWLYCLSDLKMINAVCWTEKQAANPHCRSSGSTASLGNHFPVFSLRLCLKPVPLFPFTGTSQPEVAPLSWESFPQATPVYHRVAATLRLIHGILVGGQILMNSGRPRMFLRSYYSRGNCGSEQCCYCSKRHSLLICTWPQNPCFSLLWDRAVLQSRLLWCSLHLT